MSLIRSIRFLALAVAFAAAACSDTNSEPQTKSVAAVEVIPGNRSMRVGETYRFQGRVLDEGGDIMGDRPITWVSSNPAVATVLFDGTVKAIAPGAAVIAATAETKVGTSQLTVMSGAPASIEITPGFPMLIVGETQQLTAAVKDAGGWPITDAQVTWTTDDANIVDVDHTGRVSAKGKGSATITARVGTVFSQSHVTVNDVPVASVVVTPTAIVLQTAQTRQLTATLRDTKGNVLTGRILNWTSDNAAVASVSATGLVTAVAPGYATVLAASEGVTFGVAITVEQDDIDFDLIYHRTANNGAQEILTLNPKSGGLPVVLNAGNVSRDPSPSPAGDRYAFAVSMTDLGTNARIDDIFAVNRNGLNMKRLTTAVGTDDQPAWSPVGNRIAYRHLEPSGLRGDIWLMNTDGSAQTNLTAGMESGWVLSAPAWSLDGQKIAFAGTRTGVAGTTAGIWTMNADGSDKQMLTSTLTGFDGQPSWSPDGTRIVFVRWYSGDADLAFVPATGGAVTRLPLAGDQFSPAWSPDGRHIAFAQQKDGVRPLIYTAKPDGSDVRLRTSLASGGGSDPAWITR